MHSLRNPVFGPPAARPETPRKAPPPVLANAAPRRGSAPHRTASFRQRLHLADSEDAQQPGDDTLAFDDDVFAPTDDSWTSDRLDDIVCDDFFGSDDAEVSDDSVSHSRPPLKKSIVFAPRIRKYTAPRILCAPVTLFDSEDSTDEFDSILDATDVFANEPKLRCCHSRPSTSSDSEDGAFDPDAIIEDDFFGSFDDSVSETRNRAPLRKGILCAPKVNRVRRPRFPGIQIVPFDLSDAGPEPCSSNSGSLTCDPDDEPSLHLPCRDSEAFDLDEIELPDFFGSNDSPVTDDPTTHRRPPLRKGTLCAPKVTRKPRAAVLPLGQALVFSDDDDRSCSAGDRPALISTLLADALSSEPFLDCPGASKTPAGPTDDDDFLARGHVPPSAPPAEGDSFDDADDDDDVLQMSFFSTDDGPVSDDPEGLSRPPLRRSILWAPYVSRGHRRAAVRRPA